MRVEAAVGRRLAIQANQPCWGNRLAPLMSRIDLSSGHRGRRHIQQNGISSTDWDAVSDGIASQDRRAGTGGGNTGHIVAGDHSNTSVTSGQGRVVPCRSQVPGVSQPNIRNTHVPGLGYSSPHGKDTADLPQAGFAVDDGPAGPLPLN